MLLYTFTPLHPENPAFQSGDEGHIRTKSSRKPRVLRRGVTGFTVTRHEASQRIDHYLASRLPRIFSRSQIQRLISGGGVLLNGITTTPHHKVHAEDKIEITDSRLFVSGGVELQPENIPLNVVYEDDYVIVVNKSPGMIVHPAAGVNSGTLVNAILYHTPCISAVGPSNRPGIVHRLDKDTSGLLVVAKQPIAYQQLVKQFGEHTVKRRYIALVKGRVVEAHGIINLPIGRHPRARQKMAVTFIKSKSSLTTYNVLKHFPDFTMVEVFPGTGRTHQIRVHMSFIGHPVLGDTRYGSKDVHRYKIARQALHAQTLGFLHPHTQKYIEFTAEIPDDMKNCILNMGRYTLRELHKIL